MTLLQLLLVAALSVEFVYAQGVTASPNSPLRNYTVLTGSSLSLVQGPAVLQMAAMSGETVVIRITGPQQTAIVQESVNAYMDCFPWFSRFPGGTIEWVVQDLNEDQTPSKL